MVCARDTLGYTDGYMVFRHLCTQSMFLPPWQCQGRHPGDEGYEVAVFERIYKFFGPFPASFQDFETAYPDFMTILDLFNDSGPAEQPFQAHNNEKMCRQLTRTSF